MEIHFHVVQCVILTCEATEETDEHVLEIIYIVARGNTSRFAGNARSPATELFQAGGQKRAAPRLNEAAVGRVSL